jgi:hypothetical protein
MMIAGLSVSSGLLIGNVPKAPNARASMINMANAGDMLATMDGPDMYWEEKGPLQDPPLEESDFKEYDKYSTFVAACNQHGIDLNQPDITVFAPANKACDEFASTGGELSKAVCGYHVVKGVINSDSLGSADLTTLEGSKITYRRMFRKHFVDNAFCDNKQSPPRSSYPGNIKADNGLIHMVNEVIYPGWTESSGGYGSSGDAASSTRA